MVHKRNNKGVCSLYTQVTLADDGTIEKLEVMGGCNGNLNAICQLVRGRKAEEVINTLAGTTCGTKHTSCPDQISIALREALDKQRLQ